MTDVTALMQNYRECVRHLWNSYFRTDAEPHQDWDLRDHFYDAALILFRALVLYGFDVDDSQILADYRGDRQPQMFLRLHVEHRSEILVNRTGSSGCWDDPVRTIETDDCDLRFIQYFDWWDLGFRDFAFYRVRIVGSSKYPHLVGRDALVPVTGSVKILCEEAVSNSAPRLEEGTDRRDHSDGGGPHAQLERPGRTFDGDSEE